MTDDLRYPIGPFKMIDQISAAEREQFIEAIAATPAQLRAAVEGLSTEQLDTPYRPEGWTVRQVIHHVPDSHINSYCRFKLALTEDEPEIKPYDEARWAELSDSTATPVEVSLALLENLHHRWVTLLRAMSEEDFRRAFRHPEIGLVRLDQNVSLYAWHGQHHTAQIVALRNRMGW